MSISPHQIVNVTVTPDPLVNKIASIDLQVDDEIFVSGGWAKITGVNKIQGTIYIYVDAVSLETNRKMPSLKLPKKGESTIRSREYLMSVNLLTSHDLVKELQAKLIDYSALSDAPDRIEAVPSVYIDKAPVMHALKKEIQAIHAKLGENIKKI